MAPQPQPQHKPQLLGANQPTVPHTRGRDPVADMPDTLPPSQVWELLRERDEEADEWMYVLASERETPYDAAWRLFKGGDFAQALPLLRNHLKQKPQDAGAQRLLGLATRWEGSACAYVRPVGQPWTCFEDAEDAAPGPPGDAPRLSVSMTRAVAVAAIGAAQ